MAQIAATAAALAKDPNAILNSPEQLQVRSQGALYDVVLYCGKFSNPITGVLGSADLGFYQTIACPWSIMA